MVEVDVVATDRVPLVNILVVDDSPAKLLTYEAMLEGLGANLLKASSGDAALQLLLKTEVALVLSDVMMPTLNGFEFAKLLRQHPRFHNVPIIFISAALQSNLDLLKGYASGAVDYITTPVIPELLRAKARMFVELYRLRNELEDRVRQRTAQLAQSEERYRSLVENANDIVATLDLEFKFTSINPAVERILGYKPSEIIGTPLSRYVPESQLVMQKAMLDRKLSGESSTQYETELLGKGGQQRFWLEVNSKLILDEVGRPIGIHSISRNITERKAAEARQLVLVRELQHRTKNLLAVVQSIATNTLARTASPEIASKVLMGRLHALARAQEFVGTGASGGVPLRQLLEEELSGFIGQVEIEGIPLVLGGVFAQRFALVIHELATNAAKYGSLSTPKGQLHISWTVKPDPKDPVLGFSWRERGGPKIRSEPAEGGFGSQLITTALGTLPQMCYEPQGLEFLVEVPFSELMQSDHNLSGNCVD